MLCMKEIITPKKTTSLIRLLIRLSNIKARFTNAHLTKLYIRFKGQKTSKDYSLPSKFNLKSKLFASTINDIPFFELNPQSEHSSIVCFLHGGAFVEPLQFLHLQFCDRVSYLNDITVLIPEYSRLPYSNSQQTLGELRDLMIHVRQTYPLKSIILMGDSAGAWLALSLASILQKDINIKVKELILLSPWCDLSMKNIDLRLERLDPILSYEGLKMIGMMWNKKEHTCGFDIDTSKIHAQRLHIFTGSHEILLNQAKSLVKLAHFQGVSVEYIETEGMFHDFMLFPFKESNQVLHFIAEVINIKNTH